jgi:hypothetical protein
MAGWRHARYVQREIPGTQLANQLRFATILMFLIKRSLSDEMANGLPRLARYRLLLEL